jgi:predicted  nucleic acid-binding Zn-ribbon protein
VAAIEAKAAGELEAVRAVASAEKAASDQQIAELSANLASTKAALADLEEAKRKGDAEKEQEIQELDGRLTTTAKAKEELEKQLGQAQERIALLEAEGAATRGELAQTRDTLGSEKSRADRAHSKWDQDRQALDRAKDALAVALAQIEEAENRPI